MEEQQRTGDIENGQEGRPVGSRWAEIQLEAIRGHRTDMIALWCKRLGGLVVWGFVGIVIFHLWKVAWEFVDVKLLVLCGLITTTLVYVFYKRYRQVREAGLTGLDLVRAMTVDETEEVTLRGVSRKARAVCVDFKFDPQAAFREKAKGCGFEPYPPKLGTSFDGASEEKASPSVTRWSFGKWRWATGQTVAGAREEGRDSEATATVVSASDEDRDESVSPPPGNIGSQAWGGDGMEWFHRWGRHIWGEEGAGPGAYAGTAVTEEAGPQDCGSRVGPIPGEEKEAEDEEAGGVRRDAAGVRDRGKDRAGGGSGASRSGAFAPGSSQVVRAGDLNPSCSICLFAYYMDEDVTLLPCGHLYHTECINIWMEQHVDCPYCRADLNVLGSRGGTDSGDQGANRAHVVSATTSTAPRQATASSSSPSPPPTGVTGGERDPGATDGGGA